MTGVMTGVKGQFEADYAPSLPKKDPPVLPPNEIELATSIHTQECDHCLKFLHIHEGVWYVHKCRKCSKLILSNRYEGI